jgi:hypothetical protein
MNNRRLLTLFASVLSFSALRAQNPGGIGTTNLMFWLRGDAGITTGATFTWADQSGQGRNSVQSTAADQPTVTTATTDFMNYNPGIKVVANQWLIMAGGLNNAGTTANEVFLVYKELTGAPDGMVIGTEVPGNRSYFYGSGVVQYGNSNKPTTIAPGYVADEPDIFVGKFFSATDAAQAANGAVFSALAPINAPANFTTPTAVGAQPNNGGGYNAFGYSGNVMELVGYNAEIDLTGTERQQVESYLAIKYGITLDSVGTGGNYYNSSGSSVYLGGGGSGYFNDILGIARDDNESLYQRQSHLLSDSVRLYLGATPLATTTNQANTATFSADKSYIVMGDNLGNLCGWGSNMNAKPAAVDQRLDREWKITYNTTANVFNMDITLASCAPFSSGTGNTSDLELLYSTTSPNLTTGTIMANNSNGMTISLSAGGVVTIAGLNSALASIAAAVSTGTTVYFTLASNQFQVLPLQLTNFAAVAEPLTKSVGLSWTATDQTGLASFRVMRSSDGANWQQIGQVAASGNAVGPDNYLFIDPSPLNGNNAYRLQMVNQDGGISWSSIVEVGFQPASSSITLFPNPTSDQVVIQYPGQWLSASTIRLYSAIGETLPLHITAGTGIATLSLTGLAQGVYFLQVKTPSGWQTLRLLRK